MSILKRAIFDFDDKKLKNEPIILDGGWSKWISLYPGFTQSSKNHIPTLTVSKSDLINKTTPTIKNVLDFDYPEISDLKKKPIITPVSVSNSDTLKASKLQPQLTNKTTSIKPPDPIIEKPTPNNVPLIIPNVNRSNKPSNINNMPINDNSNSSRHSNDITPSTSSSSDDEEDRKIFGKNSITKPENQEDYNESNHTNNKRPTLTPSMPISSVENQSNSLNQRVQQVKFC